MLGAKFIFKKNSDKPRDWPQILALLSASFASFSAGNLFAFTSPAIPKLLTDDYNFTIDEASYLTVIPPIGMVIGTPIFCKLTDKIGRKHTLLITGILHAISWLLTAFAKDIYVFYLARVFYGLSDASLFAAMPTYIAEVTTPKVRSLYGNIMVLTIFFGQFAANCIGFYFSIRTASLMFLSFPILFLITFYIMPESPYYLIMTKNEDAAKESLQTLRSYNDVSSELKQLNLDVDRQLSESGKFKDLWNIKSNRKSLIIANLARIFQQFSGFGSIVVYCQYFFEQAGTDISSGIAAMIVSGTVAGTTIFANIFSDKLGRKLSMMISSFGCGVILLAEASFFYIKMYGIFDVTTLNWFPVAGLFIYAVVFCIGLGVVPTIMLGEIFSTSIRKHATAVTNVIFGIVVCIIMKVFQVLMTNLGLWAPFFLFGFCCILSSIVSYFIIPETKGKTLEEIQQMLKAPRKK